MTGVAHAALRAIGGRVVDHVRARPQARSQPQQGREGPPRPRVLASAHESSTARYHPPITRDNHPIAALLLAGTLACEAPGAPACPPGSHADRDRSDALLAAARRGTATGATPGDPAICFGGAARGTLRPDGVIVLGDALSPAAATARLVHMLAHLDDQLHRFPVPDVACELQIESALAAEARAIVAEIETWHDLAADPEPPYRFTPAILAAAPAARHALVRERLDADDASDGLDLLARDYRARCPHD